MKIRSVSRKIGSAAIFTSLSMLAMTGVGATGTIAATNAQVFNAIHAAKSASVPKVLNPPLSAFQTPVDLYRQTGVSLGDACTPNLTTHASLISVPQACTFGNPAATRTVVLYGDSNVGNWLPALSTGLATSSYKLSVFLFSGCPSTDLHYTVATLAPAAMATACNTWHAAVERSILAIKPVAILAASSYELSKISTADWAAGMKRFYTNATGGSRTAKRIILGTTPFFAIPVPTCLARAKVLSQCSLSTSSSYGTILKVRDPAAAAAIGGKVLATNQWFCDATSCPPVVAGNIVAAEHDHLTIAESTYLSGVVTRAILAAVTS